MDYAHPRPRAGTDPDTRSTAGLPGSRRGRVVVWALAVATAALVAGAATAQAGSGGTSPGGDRDRGGGGGGDCQNRQFGERTLRKRDCGKDVKTLNWILKARDFAVPLERDYRDPTERSVRAFERKRDLSVDGVVESATRKKLVRSLRHQQASWYGPGFWGNHTACGQRLRHGTVGVAHRSLPCGTKVVIGYHGRWVRTRVIDRGPFVKRNYERDWDLTGRTADRLRFAGTDRIRVGVIN